MDKFTEQGQAVLHVASGIVGTVKDVGPNGQAAVLLATTGAEFIVLARECEEEGTEIDSIELLLQSRPAPYFVVSSRSNHLTLRDGRDVAGVGAGGEDARERDRTGFAYGG